jgi:hypothetical protein
MTQPQPQQPASAVEIIKSKEPERRHSSYDSSTSRSGSASRFSAARQSIVNAAVKHAGSGGTGLSAMNINGLPDPRTGLYSSQESLKASSTRASRQGAGTPQFQNLSGAVRNPNAAASSLSSSSAAAAPSGRSSITTLGGSNSNNNNKHPHLPQHHHHHGGVVPVSGSSSAASSSGCSSSEMANQTPSPSDSAVGDMETMLKEKDTEINYLRETMEQNEQVIFKVRFLYIYMLRDCVIEKQF